jgi:hypothetical protein
MVALVRSRTSDISTSASRSLRDDMRLLGMFRAVAVDDAGLNVEVEIVFSSAKIDRTSAGR